MTTKNPLANPKPNHIPVTPRPRPKSKVKRITTGNPIIYMN